MSDRLVTCKPDDLLGRERGIRFEEPGKTFDLLPLLLSLFLYDVNLIDKGGMIQGKAGFSESLERWVLRGRGIPITAFGRLTTCVSGSKRLPRMQ